MILHRTGVAGFFIAALTTLSACSDSTTVAPTDATDPLSDPTQAPLVSGESGSLVEIPTTLAPDTTGTPVVAGTPAVPDTTDAPVIAGIPAVPDTTDAPVIAGTPAVPDTTDTPVVAGTPAVPDSTGTALIPDTAGTPDANQPLTAPTATGSDLSGGEDDSTTSVESLSLVGPFIKDTSRSAGPPSVPQNLTLLLSAENWLEFSWAPSSDDQSVEAYEIYRDGQLVHTVRGDSGYEFDYRSWISTSYIDCNFTRYTFCETSSPVSGATYSYTVVAVDNEGMRSANSAPALFTLEQLSSNPVDLSAYSIVFDEEFKATDGLDRNRWKTSLPWGPDKIINGETQYFVNVFGNNPPAYDPFVFTGETLQITGIETPANLLEAANNQPYMSGILSTSDYFEMTYGYVEMSAKVAGGEGLLSTFYLFNQDYEKNKPEIDILEYIGSRPDKAYQTYHYYDSNRARYFSGEKHSSPTMEYAEGPDLSSGFHTYGVLWEPELIIWYVDGIEIRRITGPRVSDEPMNIIVQLVVGSEWIGSPEPSVIPAVFEIDYIKAWQK